MKKATKFIVFSLIFIHAIQAHAQVPDYKVRENKDFEYDEKTQQMLEEIYREVEKEISNSEGYDCSARQSNIRSMLEQPRECFVDNDCKYFNFGYPFQPSPCNKAIISVYEEEKNLEHMVRIEKFRKNCLSSEAEQNKYNQFSEQLTQATQQGKCNLQRLYCYRGYCRSKNFSVFEGHEMLKYVDE